MSSIRKSTRAREKIREDIGATAKDNRLFVEAVLYRYRAGIPWRDFPSQFGGFREEKNLEITIDISIRLVT